MMFFGDPEDDEEVEEDEPDMADDPICQINLKVCELFIIWVDFL